MCINILDFGSDFNEGGGVRWARQSGMRDSNGYIMVGIGRC